MLISFLKDKDTYVVKSKFGIFIYDIDINRELPRQNFFNRNIAREALLYLDDIFNSENIDFFLIFGTCLGAVREKDFIVYDIDIDLGIYKKDKSKLIKALQKGVANKSISILKVSDMEESITLVYKNIIIDIGLFVPKKDFYSYNNFYENKFPKRFLDKLDVINLFDRTFKVPYDVDNYLVHQYGRNWKRPIQEWNYFNKYINKQSFDFLRKSKRTVYKYFKVLKDFVDINHAKKTFLSRLFLQLNIYKISKIIKSGQGFCDTYVIYANKSIVVKKHNPKRFNFFKNSFKKIEPIYEFIDYSNRFKYEKKIFEKLYKKEVLIYQDIIVFPFIPSEPLSVFLLKDDFYIYLKKAINLLKKHDISHGDFHIDNILVDKNDNVYLIDFEMLFSDYLTKEERFYYDIFYFFAKLEYQYTNFFIENYSIIKSFINQNFSLEEKDYIVNVANKTKRYFFSVNGAKIDLFE